MSKLQELNFNEKKAIVRVDFNVPLNADFAITDDSRLVAAVPTINYVLQNGGAVILMSHLGRPKSGPEDKFSLKHITKRLSELLGLEVKFASDCIGTVAETAANELKAGEVLLLENLRFYKEEEAGDLAFSKKLASLADIYINDAFGTAHRAHASTAVMAQFFTEKALGMVMAREVENANKVMKMPSKPFTAIVGGAKVSDKILIIKNLLKIADTIIIGGGMAYTFFKATGGKIGSSLCEEDRIVDCLQILEEANAKNIAILLPSDSHCSAGFGNDFDKKYFKTNEIEDGYMGLDIGPEAIKTFSDCIKNSKTILWNGPMGVFEMSNFAAGTKAIANAVAIATENGAFSLIGGGDSAAAVNQLGYTDRVSYISTGGGALLEYFEGKELPGIACI